MLTHCQLYSLEDITWRRGLNSALVHPVVTPRFVPSSTPALLQGLGSIARRSACHVQSHISESLDNDAFVAQLHPEVTLERHTCVSRQHPPPHSSSHNALPSSAAGLCKASGIRITSLAAASGCQDLQDCKCLRPLLAMAPS